MDWFKAVLTLLCSQTSKSESHAGKAGYLWEFLQRGCVTEFPGLGVYGPCRRRSASGWKSLRKDAGIEVFAFPYPLPPHTGVLATCTPPPPTLFQESRPGIPALPPSHPVPGIQAYTGLAVKGKDMVCGVKELGEDKKKKISISLVGSSLLCRCLFSSCDFCVFVRGCGLKSFYSATLSPVHNISL